MQYLKVGCFRDIINLGGGGLESNRLFCVTTMEGHRTGHTWLTFTLADFSVQQNLVTVPLPPPPTPFSLSLHFQKSTLLYSYLHGINGLNS